MPLAIDFFIQYGYVILFLWVLAEQLGMPIPSAPLLITAGTLTATHKLNLPLALISVLLASLISDTVWYHLGKRFGGTVVRLVCRLSMESSTCVRRTEDYFTKHGPASLLLAKFIPGLGTVAAPIAGQTAMRYSTFAAYDSAGILLWCLTFMLVGRFFGDVLKKNPGALAWTAHFSVGLFALAVVGLLVYRVWKQQAFLKQVRTARLEPEELKRMLDSGKPVFIVDLRHPLDYLPDPRVLPGAVRLTPDKLVEASDEIPRDRDIVLYCTCPSEATAAKMAMNLRKLGVYRVRPLRGGFDLWKQKGFPLEDVQPAVLQA
ncbi:DedA protein [Acidisarcina polymorpha]|uniref:DedA protein n=1 Tax=Acidisarcina polymorpha TaxID=2211140 RepID=A0A2Z5G6F0_9BACT|nr:DedA family protein/thiosulfate sulfurtransferase GlpE [Acidisarcina polymorpha]AXC14367.1 DedA protein [Acidisarcina polymorpha]